jgi:uroporphyrinogen decarboxylase
MRQAGRCLPEYRKLKEKYDILTLCRTPELASEVSLMPIRRFGVDAAILFADIMLPLIAMGVDLDIVEKIGPVIKHPIRTADDIAKMRDIDAPRDLDYLGQTIKLVLGKLAAEHFANVPLIGFSGAPFTLASYLIEGKPSRDFIKTKKMMHEQPAVWHELMKKLTKNIIIYLQFQAASGVQALQIFDSWVGCLSKEEYVQYVLPYSREIFSALAFSSATNASQRKIPRIHFATNTAAFLAEFASVDCEVVGVDWRISLGEARKIIGPGKAIQGNLDPAILLSDIGTIKNKVDALLEEFGPSNVRKGFIFNLGHGVLPETPYEHLIELTTYIHEK